MVLLETVASVSRNDHQKRSEVSNDARPRSYALCRETLSVKVQVFGKIKNSSQQSWSLNHPWVTKETVVSGKALVKASRDHAFPTHTVMGINDTAEELESWFQGPVVQREPVFFERSSVIPMYCGETGLCNHQTWYKEPRPNYSLQWTIGA